MTAKSKLISRKRSKAGSYDAICLTCLATFGGCPNGELPARGKNHICDSAFLAERGILAGKESKQNPISHLPGAAA